MAKRKKKKKRSKSNNSSPANIGEKLRVALRSIIRDWRVLCEPLPLDESNEDPQSGAQRYRVRGAESYEELQERVLEFAGRVWQLKDGLIKWIETQTTLKMEFTDTNSGSKLVGTGGQDAERIIEEAAKLSIHLLLCADLYNTHKHYDDCNRSKYQPFLSGVAFDMGKSGVVGIRYDGTRKTGEITVADPNPVKFQIEMYSRNNPVNFGDAVVVVARAFWYWIPLIRQMGLLSSDNPEDKVILDDLESVNSAIKNLSPFAPDAPVVNINDLPVDHRRLANDDPAALMAKLQVGKPNS